MPTTSNKFIPMIRKKYQFLSKVSCFHAIVAKFNDQTCVLSEFTSRHATPLCAEEAVDTQLLQPLCHHEWEVLPKATNENVFTEYMWE